MKAIPITLFVLALALTGTKSFGQDKTSFPLEVTIRIDSVYSYSYSLLRRFNATDFLTFLTNSKRACKIQVTLKNKGKKNIYVHLMSCSNWEQMRLDNKLVDFLWWGCDKNIPERHELRPGASDHFYIDVVRDLHYYTSTEVLHKPFLLHTRLGILLAHDIYDSSYDWPDFSKLYRTNSWAGIVWSNSISL